MSAEVKMNRIKAAHKSELNLLTDVVKTAQKTIPKLQQTAEAAHELRNMEDTLSTLGAYVKANGFDPTRTFQHVAKFDTEVWTLILDMFAKYDPETGELMDDGLLYKYDPAANALKLNKDFFYAIVSYFDACGIECDMRAKINVH